MHVSEEDSNVSDRGETEHAWADQLKAAGGSLYTLRNWTTKQPPHIQHKGNACDQIPPLNPQPIFVFNITSRKFSFFTKQKLKRFRTSNLLISTSSQTKPADCSARPRRQNWRPSTHFFRFSSEPGVRPLAASSPLVAAGAGVGSPNTSTRKAAEEPADTAGAEGCASRPSKSAEPPPGGVTGTWCQNPLCSESVSYTHLTLPTSSEV